MLHKSCIRFSQLLIIIYIFIANTYMNCNDWAKGLNNTYIDNNIEIHDC